MRVTIVQAGSEGVVMKIEGKIVGLRVQELHRAWQELAPSLAQRSLLVDLRGVTHVDGLGRNLLAHIHRQSAAQFLADTPLTKHFAEQARKDSQTLSNSDQ